jgi:DNA polymerase III subunit delta'
LKPLDALAMAKALASALPEADEREIEALVRAGEGSPGRAVAFQGLDIDALDRSLKELAEKGDPTNARRSQLAQSLALKAAQPRYEVFLARVPSLIAAKAKGRRGPALADALRLWERAQDLSAGAVRLSLEPQSVVFELAGMVAALAPDPSSGRAAAGKGG